MSEEYSFASTNTTVQQQIEHAVKRVNRYYSQQLASIWQADQKSKSTGFQPTSAQDVDLKKAIPLADQPVDQLLVTRDFYLVAVFCAVHWLNRSGGTTGGLCVSDAMTVFLSSDGVPHHGIVSWLDVKMKASEGQFALHQMAMDIDELEQRVAAATDSKSKDTATAD